MTLVKASFLIELLLLMATNSGRSVGIRLAGSSLAIADIAHGYADRSVIRIAHCRRIALVRYMLESFGGAIGRRALRSRHWFLRESEFRRNRCSMTFDDHAWLKRDILRARLCLKE